MTKTLKRIAPLQLGKVLGAVYGLLSLLFIPFFLIFALIGSMMPSQNSGTAPMFAVGTALLLAIAFPIMYGVMGFILGVIGAWGYNLIAGWIGGIKVDVE